MAGSLIKSISLAVFLAAAFAAAPGPFPASAEEGVLKKEKKLEDVRRRLREEKQELKTISSKESSILGDIEDVNRRIVRARRELRKINARLSSIRSEMAEVSGRVEKLEAEREKLLERLEKRVAAMYVLRRGEAVRVLFSSDDSVEAGRRHKYLTVIMEEDSRLIDTLEANIGELERERAELESLGERLEGSRAEAAAARKRAEADERKKRRILARIQREKDRKEAMVSELEEAARELANLLKDIRGSDDITGGEGFAAMKGRLAMPVKGRVVSTYGRVTHPRFKTVTFNNGIVIDAPDGADVKSVYPGRIVHTGWLKGYGQIMIVDHGGGFYTLFAYLREILGEKGSKVEKGDVIARVGSTGPRPEPGLYFEIRRRGVPKDPSPWFASR